MILIIGGSFQGKKAYTAQICKDERILADFQDRIRAVLEAGEDPEAFTRQILVTPPAVITLDEVGCGIVSGSGSRGLPDAVRHCSPDQIKEKRNVKQHEINTALDGICGSSLYWLSDRLYRGRSAGTLAPGLRDRQPDLPYGNEASKEYGRYPAESASGRGGACLLYTSDAADDS